MRRVLRPIKSIGEAMKEIQGGNQERKIPVEGTNELWQLTEQYNDMVDALHQQREEVQRNFEEKTRSIQQRNQAERQALESQIDAHFICNTLNAINYNVLEAGNFEVAEMLRNLSDILLYERGPRQRPACPHRHHRAGMAHQHHLVHDGGGDHELLGGHPL